MERWESFYLGAGAPQRGVLGRRYDHPELTTRIVFPIGDGELFRAESVIRFEDDGQSWERAEYRQEPGGVSSAVDRDAAELGETTLPSYGEYLLLLDVVTREAQEPAREEFLVLADSDPLAGAATAAIAAAGTETVDVPGGRRECRRFDVVAGGRRTSSHWAADGVVVKSEWNGAESYLGEREHVLAGLDEPILAFAISGFAEAHEDPGAAALSESPG
ncbi:hypothetical protein [Bogoriella caseilytica]|uniref:Uncharacterized protein n=1 Tax=Bogoriella caseilytica TaxID=56055 RepID=A0A3N2B975_9MICO|nr:hypothetical protein [Bogoriella caseilytica]ROR71825.1 hypothetical protein EDD31_0163 [Bogoriella caseilytica]